MIRALAGTAICAAAMLFALLVMVGGACLRNRADCDLSAAPPIVQHGDARRH